jgi:hypothetical protein
MGKISREYRYIGDCLAEARLVESLATNLRCFKIKVFRGTRKIPSHSNICCWRSAKILTVDSDGYGINVARHIRKRKRSYVDRVYPDPSALCHSELLLDCLISLHRTARGVILKNGDDRQNDSEGGDRAAEEQFSESQPTVQWNWLVSGIAISGSTSCSPLASGFYARKFGSKAALYRRCVRSCDFRDDLFVSVVLGRAPPNAPSVSTDALP